MAYTPTTWETGDLITAEKMNKLEQGFKMNRQDLLGKMVPLQALERQRLRWTPTQEHLP